MVYDVQWRYRMEVNDSLRLIVLNNCSTLGYKVNESINKTRQTHSSYIVPIRENRFSNGEGKIVIEETVREKDVYILSDVGNHGCTYEMFGNQNVMGPDEHYQDIKRVISAIKGHTSSITVVMPLLYASRQHKRKGRESLDCAVALQELEALGVKAIITFDAHDPNVQNAVPCLPFENFYPTNSILKDFINNETIDFHKLIVVSPDTGAMDRARYYADMLKCDVGMFYKRRDLSKVVNGKNPIVAHEYMGTDVAGKNIIIVDDMIASGDSILEVAKELKNRKAENVYLVATFSLFTNGIKSFEDAYAEGLFNKLYSTNLSYVPEYIKQEPWFKDVDCSIQLANIIDTINKKQSISHLLNGKQEILELLNSKINV